MFGGRAYICGESEYGYVLTCNSSAMLAINLLDHAFPS